MPQPYINNNFSMGIDRNRNQSPPKDGMFYDLVNCYLSPGHTVKRRPGFTKDQAIAGGFGLTSYAGKLHTFYSGADPGSNALIQTHKLVCPDGSGSALSKVYYVAPLAGYLYVVAGFANGKTYHFYLDDVNLGLWGAATHLNYGDVRAPTVENGLHFQVTSKAADQSWAPGIGVTAGVTYVQPSIGNGWRYLCTAVQLPAGITLAFTGNTEPAWPLAVGATVVETIIKDETITKTGYQRFNDGTQSGDYYNDWRPGYSHAAGEMIVPKRLRGQGIGMVASYNALGINYNYTGNAEPTWSTAVGATINDGTITWTVVKVTTITWTCESFNVTGGIEPVWPIVPGNTVVDGTATWTAIGRNITDPNCPQSNSAVVAAGKVWAIDVTGKVRFCGVANARAWSTVDAKWTPGVWYNIGDLVFDVNNFVQKCTSPGTSGQPPPDFSTLNGGVTNEAGAGTPSWINYGIAAPGDAGYLPISLQASGDTTPLSLGLYRGNLVVFTGSGFQIWQIDQNPANSVILDAFEGVGTPFLRGAASIAGDLYFVTLSGIRSLSTVAVSGNFQPGDAGMPIDQLVAPNLSMADTFSPFSCYVPNLGQYWFVNGQNVYVMSNYPALAVGGWSRYTLPWTPVYTSTLNGILYVIANDGNLYHLNQGYYQDDTAGAASVYTMQIVWPYEVLGRHTMFQPFATMGYEKIVRGVDLITSVPMTLQCGYDESDLTKLTPAITVGPDDRVGGIVPVEVMCESFSPQLSHAVNQAAEVMSITTWYDVLQQAVA